MAVLTDIDPRFDQPTARRHHRAAAALFRPEVPLRWRSWLLILGAVLAACADETEQPRESTSLLAAEALVGVYAGRLPCADCPGIELTVWIRDDGRFFLRQEYLAPADADDQRFHALGRWLWHADERLLILAGKGPERRFSVPEAGRLELQDEAGMSELVRFTDTPEFTDTLTLDGEFHPRRERPLFIECLTGLGWPIAQRGAYRSLLQRFRAIPRGETALARIRGRLQHDREKNGGAETLVVEEVMGLQPGRCSTGKPIG